MVSINATYDLPPILIHWELPAPACTYFRPERVHLIIMVLGVLECTHMTRPLQVSIL